MGFGKRAANRSVSVVGKKPMLLLTGFLGAGKTTLLREVVHELGRKGVDADVILNDRENALIDRDALADDAAWVGDLTGACVCCEGMDELCELILKSAEHRSDVLLIELNGTADPLPLQETFTLLESRFMLRPRWQVCVVDCRYFGRRKYSRELERMQLETASFYYYSHAGEVSDEEFSEVVRMVRGVNPYARSVEAGELAELLREAVSEAVPDGSAVSSVAGDTADDVKPALGDRHQLAHVFSGCNLVFPSPVDAELVERWLEALPASVVRVKALVEVQGETGCRYLYERVGEVISPRPLKVRSITASPCSGIFIGPTVEPDEILRITRELLSPDSYFPDL